MIFDLSVLFLCLLVFYHHIGFSLLLKRRKPRQTVLPAKEDNWPRLSLIIPAYNEADYIFDKILNCASLDYPPEKLEIILACDGCTDDTYDVALKAARLKEAQHLNIEILNYSQNRGKVCVLNEAIKMASGEIVALSDTSSLISLDGLKRVACHFETPQVGVVGATYHYLQPQDISEDTYWRYQRTLKKGEAGFGAPMGMHGAFYAFRKNLAKPLSASTINDDFILPMKIIAQGYQAIYDEKIRCVETENQTRTLNWSRRVRISAGNVQQALSCLELLNFKQPGISFCFLSGKFLRAFMPLILCLIFTLSVVKAFDDPFYQGFLGLQVLGLGVCFLPTRKTGRFQKFFKILRYLIIGHVAGLVGTIRYLFALERGVWKRAQSKEVPS